MDHQENEHETLERISIDASVDPVELSYAFLKNITNGFSQVIGRGGFGVVYMGVSKNRKVAVKKLSMTLDFSGKQFEDELQCLKRVKHKNIVRCLGYCSYKEEKLVWHDEKYVLAEERQRFLCFEYVPNKSLHDYLKDESCGREWKTHYYHLIEGICQGLRYLHNEERINHLDLKPDNILLDADHAPKITDFGLSRRFSGAQSRKITENIIGSQGYIAPEYRNKGEISFKADIFSLGMIIINLLKGSNDLSDFENWQQSLDVDCPQVKRCIRIAQLCVDNDRCKRPTIDNIIDMLNGKEIVVDMVPPVFDDSRNNSGSSQEQVDEVQPMNMSTAPSPLQRIISVPKGPGETSTEIRPGSSEMLDIHPLELRFPWEPYKSINCPVTLTNRTDCYVGVWIKPTCPQTHSDIRFPVLWGDKSLKDPSSSVFQEMGPNITLVVAMTLEEEQQPPQQDTGKFEVLMIVMGSEKDLKKLGPPYGRKRNMDSDYLKRVEELGGEVHRAILKAVICDPANCQEVIRNLQFIPALSKFGDVKAIDVHPTEAWILIVHGKGCVSIWNYQTQEPVMVLQVTKTERMLFFTHSTTQCKVSSAKFIAQKQWIVTGGSDGWIHVYADATKVKVKEFEAYPGTSGVSSLAVHPNHPFLLTSSNFDDTIKLWDWHQGWKCTRKFDNGPSKGINIMWIPRDYADRTFVSATLGNVKIWEIHSTDPITTFKGWYHGCCLYSDSHRNFLVIGSDFSPIPLPHVRGAQIWDMQTKKHVHTLNLTNYPVISDVVACHPKLQILASVSDSFVCLWDARTYRLEQIVELPSRPVKGMAFIDTWGLTRLVVGCEKNIAIMEINLPTLETDLQTGGAN